jgi:hypothetical protein
MQGSPVVIGVPVTHWLYGVPTIHETTLQFDLATHHLNAAGGVQVKKGDIKQMELEMSQAASMPTWRMEQWNKNVFSRFLPCSVMYNDAAVTKSFIPGKQCIICFTHQAATGMNMELAKKYKDNILAVLHHDATPHTTQMIADRLATKGLPFGMTSDMIHAAVPAINVKDANSKIKGIFSACGVKVERISTCMGCVMTTCVVDVDALPKLTAAMMEWAKPIITANQIKGNVCTEFRMQTEKDHNICNTMQQGRGIPSGVNVATSIPQGGRWQKRGRGKCMKMGVNLNNGSSHQHPLGMQYFEMLNIEKQSK